MKKLGSALLALPTLLVMTIFIPIGFFFEVIKIGFEFGQIMFEDFNKYIKNS